MIFQLRCASKDDLTEIQILFVETINVVCAGDYSHDQISVWTSSIKDKERWIEKIANQFFVVAIFDNQIVGFGSLADGDHVDLMYTHKDFQKQGIANMILESLEAKAKSNGKELLHADVSKTAKSFFAKRGFSLIAEQSRIINDVEICNYKMEKRLAGSVVV